MIVRYFYVLGTVIRPPKAHSILVVHPYGVLPFSILMERMKLVIRRHLKIVEVHGGIYHSKLSPRDPENVCRKALGAVAVKYLLRFPISKAPDWHQYLMWP